MSAKVPSPSFRKVERTAKGTLLVSSLVRNLLSNNPSTDYGQQSSQRSPVPYRVLRLASEMTSSFIIIVL